MIKVYTSDNISEALMLKEFLENEKIEIRLHEELLRPTGKNQVTIWVKDPKDEIKAKEIINEVINDSNEPEINLIKPFHDPSKTSFFVGAVAGILLCLLGVYIYETLNKEDDAEPTSWDSNHDGKIDTWSEYKDGHLVKFLYDNNFDGEVDGWNYYEDDIINYSEYDLNYDGTVDQKDYYINGIIHKSEWDNDYNGQPDEWKYYRKGNSLRYTADNDGDGKIDEWGTYEKNIVNERFWSFKNDKIADKKAIYKNGRRISESYDRDRDGKYDEIVILDAFERVVDTKFIKSK